MVVETGSPCYRLCCSGWFGRWQPWSSVFRCIRRGVTGTSVTGGTAAWQVMTIHIVSWDNVTDQLFERVGWVNSSWCWEVGVGG